MFVALVVCLLTLSEQIATRAEAQAQNRETAAVQIYSAADDGSPSVGTLQPGESITPIAEIQATGGASWFLIKTKSGIIGWIKRSDNETAKSTDRFFKSLPVENPAVASAIPNLSSDSAPPGAVLVPVLFLGHSAVVRVTLNQTITGNLMLDTGATHTVISQRLARLVSLRPTGRSAAQTVGGLVAVTVSRLRSLKVGELQVNDLPVLIHDFSSDPRIEGLLGMDFLGRYRFGLDARRQLLVLSPR